MPIEKRDLIPQPFQGEMKVTLVLPEEALSLMRDLHRDREGIALGGIVLLGCVLALTIKRFFDKE